MSIPIPALERLQNDHKNLDSLLCILDRQLYGATRGDTPDFILLRDILRYMTLHADRTHHAFEDRLFARLVQRYPKIEPTLELIKEEHHEIARYGGELHTKLAAIVDTHAGCEWGLATMNLAQAYSELFRAHIRREESEVFGLLVERLTAQDWLELVTRCDWGCDPLFRADAAEEYRALKSYIAELGVDFPVSREARGAF